MPNDRLPVSLLAVALGSLASCGDPPPQTAAPNSQPSATASVAAATAASTPPESRGAVGSPEDIADFNRGIGLMGTFAFEDAEAVFRDLLRRRPGDRDAKRNLAIALLNQTSEGGQERGLELLKELLDGHDADDRSHYCAGLVELFLGNPDRALGHFAPVAEGDPKDPYAAFYVGQCLEYAGRYEDARGWYERSAALDPYLRSPHLGLQRVLARVGRYDESEAALAAFSALDGNPRAQLAEFKYTRMGRRAEVTAPVWAAASPRPVPMPPFFDHAPIAATSAEGDAPPWRREGAPPSMIVADLDGSGPLDLFIADALADGGNAVLFGIEQGNQTAYRWIRDHPLSSITGVRTALVGDIDNDGHADLYLCRRGLNRLYRSLGNGTFEDITEASGTDGGDHDTVDGAMADLDHDGDLDIYLVHADGPCELFSNDFSTAHGPFRAIGAASGASGDGRPGRQILVGDLDHDRDADLILLHEDPPHSVLINDRLWSYRPEEGTPFATMAIDSLVGGDGDVDGDTELIALSPEGSLYTITRHLDGAWSAARLVETNVLRRADGGGLALLDVGGLGTQQVMGRTATSFVARGLNGDVVDEAPNPPYGTNVRAWTPLVQGTNGPSILVLSDEGLALLGPTASRGPFLTVALAGRIDPSQAMRSNAAGIGASVVVRRGDEWSWFDTFRSTSGPGQSLQPWAIGLGSQQRADFIAIEWSDGVMQTELALEPGRRHELSETQRRISSCPVIFAWDGTTFRFVTDCLGVGGIGYLLGVRADDRGCLQPEYAPPRPWERVLLPESLPLVPRDGALELRLGEPMEEAFYLDAVRLVVHDLPPGWAMTIDERMGLAEPLPTGDARYYRRTLAPSSVRDRFGRDVSAVTRAVDGVAMPLAELDPRFIGRLSAPQVVTMEFASAIDELPGEPTLVAHGWIEYPYCQTAFAAWQAGATFDAPNLEARGADGAWTVVLGPWGYPAGMPREMSVPLRDLPRGTNALRISTNQEIYWDAFAVVGIEPAPRVRVQSLALHEASIAECGFPQRRATEQKRPDYDYAKRPPFWGTRHQPGFYTALGPCRALLESIDDAVAVIGPGEEIRVRFGRPLEEPPEGWTRRYVLEVEGWCKDMDLFTGEGETVEPLPQRENASSRTDAECARRDDLHRATRTRWRSGY